MAQNENEPEKDDQKQPETENQSEETTTKKQDEKTEKLDEEPVPPQEPPKKHEKQGKDKQKKTGKEDTKKKEEPKDENFRYIVRIANTDLDGNKTLEYGLTQIKGIGHHMSMLITDNVGIDKKIKVGNLTDPQIEKLKEALENLSKFTPVWMLNHRKDFDTGTDMHLISTEVATKLRDDINLMKMIRCYKGVRHEYGLPVRGQRTKSNGRSGLAMGVSKQKVAQRPAAAKKEE
ncbi:MAG: 30S ribosomal protein S13 [Methanobacteriota archaeon]